MTQTASPTHSYKPGDTVYLNDTAREDIGLNAWSYVDQHRTAQILHVVKHSNPQLPASEDMLFVVWPENFAGGIGFEMSKASNGQYVTAKHAELCFEASRAVVTIPHIEGVGQTCPT